MSRKEAEPAGQDGSSSSATDGAGGSGSGRELADALARRRLYREVTLALRSGLRDAKADFSFLRARGLRSLLGFLRSTASAADDARLLLFRHSQSIPDLQGIVPPPHFGDLTRFIWILGNCVRLRNVMSLGDTKLLWNGQWLFEI